MILLAIILLTVVQFLSGTGIVALFGIRLTGKQLIPVALLLGIAVFGLVPFIMQLLHIPLSAGNVFGGLGVATILLNVKFKTSIALLKDLFKGTRLNIKLYELPFIAVIGFIIFVSVWRCYYYPPLPRDLTSGAEVIAEYATKEHTMVNSVFKVDLSTTNNQFKPPFITSLQIIYKYAGFPFGQIWLCTVFISFILLLYQLLTRKLHPLLAGILLLFFLAIPEMYAYTIMALFDYSNAVYFFLATWVLYLWVENKSFNYLLFAGLIMGIATYVRSETLILAGLFVPFFLYHQFFVEKNRKITAAIARLAAFLAPSVLLYVLSITIYINYYLPVQYAIDGQLNKNLADVGQFFTRWNEINTSLLTGENSYMLYGYLIVIFIVLFLLEAIFFKLKFNGQGKFWLYTVLIIYLGYPLLGYLLPLLDLNNSTKRGLFKLFPLILLYLANNQILLRISGWLSGQYAKKA